MMRSLLFFVLLAVALVSAQNQDVFFIDEFVVETPLIITVIPNGASFPLVDTAFTQGSTASIIGGERDIQLTVLSGDSNLVLTSGVAAGDFTASTPNEARGNSLVQYDGVDGSINLDMNGLGPVDFTVQNAFAIRVSIETDLPTDIDFTVYSGGNQCTRTVNAPGGDTQNDFILNYSEFSGNCDFSTVGAFEILVNMQDNVDVLIQEISVFGPVPQTPTPSRTPSPVPSVSPSPTPSASDTCVCRCPIFVCEVFRLDDGDYYFYDSFFLPTIFFETFFTTGFYNPTFFNEFFIAPFYTTFFSPTYFLNFGLFFDIWEGVYFN